MVPIPEFHGKLQSLSGTTIHFATIRSLSVSRATSEERSTGRRFRSGGGVQTFGHAQMTTTQVYFDHFMVPATRSRSKASTAGYPEFNAPGDGDVQRGLGPGLAEQGLDLPLVLALPELRHAGRVPGRVPAGLDRGP